MVARHTILRTAFFWQDLGQPLQVVYESVTLPFEVMDFRSLDEAERQVRLEQWVEADYRRGFELGEAPLMRFTLVRLSDTSHRLVWSFHHMLLDGWSSARLLEEWGTLYRALRQGEDSPLRPAERPISSA